MNILNQFVALLNDFSFLKEKCTTLSQIFSLLEPHKKKVSDHWSEQKEGHPYNVFCQ